MPNSVKHLKKHKQILLNLFGSILMIFGCLTLPSHAQTAGSFDWSALGYTNGQDIPSGTNFTSAGVTTTVNWSIEQNGGLSSVQFLYDDVYFPSGRASMNNITTDPDDKILVDFNFSAPVENLVFTISDFDQGDWDDFIEVYYDAGNGLVNAKSGTFVTAQGSYVSDDDESFGDGWEGDIGSTTPNNPDGTLTLSFGSLYISRIHVKYFSGDDGSNTNPGFQYIYLPNFDYQSVPIESDLSLSKTVDKVTPIVGDTVNYTLTVTNNGPFETAGIQVRDILPSGVLYNSDTSGGNYNSATGIWTLPSSLALGASSSIQIEATVQSSGSYFNQAEIIASNENDPDSTPNNASTNPNEDDTDSVSIIPSSSPFICPVNMQSTDKTANAISVFSNTGVSNASRALGTLAAEGTSPPDSFAAELDNATDEFVLFLDDGIPQNAPMSFSLARDGAGPGKSAKIEILFSVDGVSFTSAGIYAEAPANYVSTSQDQLERFTIINPVIGAQYVKFDSLDSDDGFVDALEYYVACEDTPSELTAIKSVYVIASSGGDTSTCAAAAVPATNNEYALPGACMEYTISVTNPGGLTATNINLTDVLADNLTFAGMSQSTFTGGTLRTTDDAAIPNTIGCTSSTTACTVRLEDATLAGNSTGELKIRVLIE